MSVIVLAAVASSSRAVVFLRIHDAVDDFVLVDAVSGQKPVKESAAKVRAIQKIVIANDVEKNEKLFGKPVRRHPDNYAMPVAQSRSFMISGIRYGDETMNKDHTDFHPIGDFAAIEIHYGIDGKSPSFALLYFKMDKAFPGLKKVEDKDAEKPAKTGTTTRKNTIDIDHWNQIKQEMNKEKVAELFSTAAGDYAPGTDYLTRSSGSRHGGDGKVHETLEWRSANGRIVVEFDAKGKLVTSEYFKPGRDPVTNISERLKWDQERFDKVKKYIEDRIAAK